MLTLGISIRLSYYSSAHIASRSRSIHYGELDPRAAAILLSFSFPRPIPGVQVTHSLRQTDRQTDGRMKWALETGVREGKVEGGRLAGGMWDTSQLDRRCAAAGRGEANLNWTKRASERGSWPFEREKKLGMRRRCGKDSGSYSRHATEDANFDGLQGRRPAS